MKTYTNLNALLKDLGKDVGNSLAVSLKSQEVKEFVVEGIDEGLGTPDFSFNPYIRRGRDGGLTDPHLVKASGFKIEKPKGAYKFSMNLRSHAQGNEDWRGGLYPRMSINQFCIDEIIETGFGYSWKNSAYYNPNKEAGYGRPIYQKAAEKLAQDDRLASIIANELANRGW